MYSTLRINFGFFSVEKRSVFLIGILMAYSVVYAQHTNRTKRSSPDDSLPAIAINIREHLDVFNDSVRADKYLITLCADVPYNRRPMKVAHKQETGHVFIILQKINPGADTVSGVFGFYPKAGFQAVLFKRVKSAVKDNSCRRYDVSVTLELSAEAFDTAVSRAITQASPKYHMNRYNCYDYAMYIFNAVAGNSPLPFRHIRFPFLFGRGGSPCGVYRDLKELKESRSLWGPAIVFGDLRAPVSTARAKAQEVESVAIQ